MHPRGIISPFFLNCENRKENQQNHQYWALFCWEIVFLSIQGKWTWQNSKLRTPADVSAKQFFFIFSIISWLFSQELQNSRRSSKCSDGKRLFYCTFLLPPLSLDLHINHSTLLNRLLWPVSQKKSPTIDFPRSCQYSLTIPIMLKATIAKMYRTALVRDYRIRKLSLIDEILCTS